MANDNLPKGFMNYPWYRWRGDGYPVVLTNNIFIIGCPVCGDGIPCHGEPRDEMWLPHSVHMAESGAITVTPSVVCPRGCGWHVVITDGEAVDA